MATNQGAEYEPDMFNIQVDTSSIPYDPDFSDDFEIFITVQDNTNAPINLDANISESHMPVVTVSLICQECRQTWRVRNLELWQTMVIMGWIKRYPVKPTNEQKLELLDGSMLKRQQLKGILERAWEAGSVSHRAVKTVSLVETASNPTTHWVTVNLDEHENNLAGENAPDAVDPRNRLEFHDGDMVEWYLKNCLPCVGSQFPYQHSSHYTNTSLQSTSSSACHTRGEANITVGDFYLTCDFCRRIMAPWSVAFY